MRFGFWVKGLLMSNITIRKPDDFHLHIRQGEAMKSYLSRTTSSFARAIIMPNTQPAVYCAADMISYRNKIVTASDGSGFKPLMTFALSPKHTKTELEELKKAGVVAAKYYPAGATTNSEHGIKKWSDCEEQLAIISDLEIPLSIHGEDPDAPALEREDEFIPSIDEICNKFPKLKVIFEHISSRHTVEKLVGKYSNLGFTVTLHHLLITQEDIFGGALNPHNFCRPMAKTAKDRDALVELVLSGENSIFFGSDSAPHLKANKECAGAAAGLYSAPVLLPALVQFFADNGKLDLLEPFTSEYGAQFYGLELNNETITLEEKSWIVDEIVDGVVPFMSGQEIRFGVV